MKCMLLTTPPDLANAYITLHVIVYKWCALSGRPVVVATMLCVTSGVVLSRVRLRSVYQMASSGTGSASSWRSYPSTRP